MATSRRETLVSVTIIRLGYEGELRTFGPNPRYIVVMEGARWRRSADFRTLKEARAYAENALSQELEGVQA